MMAMIAETAKWSQSTAGVDGGAAGRRGPGEPERADLSLSSLKCFSFSSVLLEQRCQNNRFQKIYIHLGNKMLSFMNCK